MFRHFIVRFFPRFAERCEAESREWLIQCPNCGHEVSVWDAGGIRYKARGTVYRYGKCSRCNERHMLKVYHRHG